MSRSTGIACKVCDTRWTFRVDAQRCCRRGHRPTLIGLRRREVLPFGFGIPAATAESALVLGQCSTCFAINRHEPNCKA